MHFYTHPKNLKIYNFQETNDFVLKIIFQTLKFHFLLYVTKLRIHFSLWLQNNANSIFAQQTESNEIWNPPNPIHNGNFLKKKILKQKRKKNNFNIKYLLTIFFNMYFILFIKIYFTIFNCISLYFNFIYYMYYQSRFLYRQHYLNEFRRCLNSYFLLNKETSISKTRIESL